MTIFVKNLENLSRSFEVSPTILVSDFILLIRRKDNISQELPLILNSGTKTLQPHLPLSDYEVNNFSTLFLSVRLVGGTQKRKNKNGPPSHHQTPSKETPKKDLPPPKITPISPSSTTTTTTSTFILPEKTEQEVNILESFESSNISHKASSDSLNTETKKKRESAKKAEIIIEQATKIQNLEKNLKEQKEEMAVQRKMLENMQSLLITLVSEKEQRVDSEDQTSPLFYSKEKEKDNKIAQHTSSPYAPFSPSKLVIHKTQFSNSEEEEPIKSVPESLIEGDQPKNPLTQTFDLDKEIAYVFGTEKQQKRFSKKTVDSSYKLKVDQFSYDLDFPFQKWWDKFRHQVQSCGLIGFVEQIEYLFQQKMSEDIQDFFEELNTGAKLTLRDMIYIVLCNYNKAPKSIYDYGEELDSIRKTVKETVSSYYLRLCNLAQKAEVKDIFRLRRLYVRGLAPKNLFMEVNKKIDINKTTLLEAHKMALEAEEQFNRLKEYDKLHPDLKSKNPKNQSQDKNNTDNTHPTDKTTKNKIKKQKQKNYIHSSNATNGKNTKSPNPICGFCSKEHDYKECQLKYPFYKPFEIATLKSVNKEPVKRTNWPSPDKYLDKDTPWIKALLEKKDAPHTEKKATISVINNPTSTSSESSKGSSNQPTKK
jgi:hypothetical protein